MSFFSGTAVRKPAGSEGRDRSAVDENLVLVRKMGAPWYDPIPTEQYTCFVDPVFTLTPRGHRMLALLRSYTIRGKGPQSGRTPYAHDGRRTLHLKDFAAELGLEPAAAYKVWRELEEAGLGRMDEKKRLWLTGKVSPRRQTKGEDEEALEPELTEDQQWEKLCTDNFPAYLAEQFQCVSKTERHSVHTDVESWDKYEKRAAAEAMDAARKQVQTLRD